MFGLCSILTLVDSVLILVWSKKILFYPPGGMTDAPCRARYGYMQRSSSFKGMEIEKYGETVMLGFLAISMGVPVASCAKEQVISIDLPP